MPITYESAVSTRTAVLGALRDKAAGTDGLGRLAGKVGVITGVGPAAGIGAQTARLFAREGASALYLVDVSKDLEPFAAALGKEFANTKIVAVTGDAAAKDVIKGTIERIVAEDGRLDFFFANAGVSMLRPPGAAPNGVDVMQDLAIAQRTVDQISEDEWMEVMRINALSVFLALKYAPPAMGALGGGKDLPGGAIVCTASIAGLRANAGPIAYSASKAAIVSMVQNGAYALAGQNIRVNAICPGLIQTDMTKLIFEGAKLVGKPDGAGDANPLMRQGLPQEIAHAALWLASTDASYVNGQAIAVDGALTNSVPYDPARRVWKPEA